VRYTSWKCGDIDPYNSDIPTGTTCTTTCPAWRGLEVLESTCVEGNQWTNTKVQWESPVGFRALPYATTIYNTPDMDDMVCGCRDLGPFNYNPNNPSEGAELVCTGGKDKNFDAPWNLTTTDRCDLFCNNVPAGSVFCDGTKWVGKPEKGFWCYTSPENPGPSCVLVEECASRVVEIHEEVCNTVVELDQVVDAQTGEVSRTVPVPRLVCTPNVKVEVVQECTNVCEQP